MIKLKDKKCVITGAASGIGRSLAIELVKEGANLFLADIDIDKLTSFKKEISNLGATVFIEKCDVSKFDDFKNLANKAYSNLGDVDILINNAGIGGGGFVETIELEEWKKIFDVNIWSIIYSIKVFLPKMLERGSGYIINTGSAAGIIGLSAHINYVASKFAVVGISEALFGELASKGIKVSVICPTVVRSNIIQKADIAIPKNLLSDNIKDVGELRNQFKTLFWERYMDIGKGITPDEAVKKYIKGIKKQKLYIFDKKLLPLAMFIKGISRKRYEKILKRIGKEYEMLIIGVLKDLKLLN
jgi:short-subunit dehydrogenase